MTPNNASELDEPGMDEMERAMRAVGMPQSVPHAVPLDYASRRAPRAPIDWYSTIRQVVFAAGVGFIAGAVTDCWASNPWKDNEVMWIGCGAAMVALTLPWPGRIGRRRE